MADLCMILLYLFMGSGITSSSFKAEPELVAICEIYYYHFRVLVCHGTKFGLSKLIRIPKNHDCVMGFHRYSQETCRDSD